MESNSHDNSGPNFKLPGVEVVTDQNETKIHFDTDSEIFKILKFNADVAGMEIQEYVMSLLEAGVEEYIKKNGKPLPIPGKN